MKNFFQTLLVLSIAGFLLWGGYCMVLNNLNYLLASGKNNFQCRIENRNILIQTGNWVEVINLDSPRHLVVQTQKWLQQSVQAIMKEFKKKRYFISIERYFNRIKMVFSKPKLHLPLNK